MTVLLFEMSQDLGDEYKIVDMILESNKHVRYVCICDSEGKILWNSCRGIIESMMTLEDTEESLKTALENWKKRDKITEKIGRGKYSIVSYEKLKRITIPLRNNHLLYVHVDADKPENIDDMIKIVESMTEHSSLG